MKQNLKSFAVLAAPFALLALFATGCSQQQLTQAQADIQKLQAQYGATTQAVDAAQRALDAANAALSGATTQPGSDVPAFQKAVQQAQAVLAQAVQHESQAQAVLTQAQNVVASMKNGTAPDVSPLHAFGPYGDIAGLIIAAGFGVYQMVQKNQKVGLLNGLAAAAGTDDHATAVAQATQALSAPVAVIAPKPA